MQNRSQAASKMAQVKPAERLAVPAPTVAKPAVQVKQTIQEVIDAWLAETKANMLAPQHKNQLDQLEEALPELVKRLESR